MKVRLLQEAEREFREAILHYESLCPGLGKELRDEASHYIEWIVKNPTALRKRPGNYWRANFKTFPYYIPYIIEEETIWDLAFAHSSSKPKYWIDRV